MCTMAVALHQQCIYDLHDIQCFDYENYFEDCFVYYKEYDKNIGTNNGIDIVGINEKTKSDIQWLIFWCIYKNDTTINNPEARDPEQWTIDKSHCFRTECSNNTITPKYIRIDIVRSISEPTMLTVSSHEITLSAQLVHIYF